MHIKEATESDLATVLSIHQAAFGPEAGAEIADLVSNLLNDSTAKPFLSLLAMNQDQAVGHILFTKATLRPAAEALSVRLLAPLAVLPEAQLQGVGRQLIQAGLKRLSDDQVDLVFVLGHPTYYPRYGFQPAGLHGLTAPYPIPPHHADAWMVQALQPDLIGRVSGQVMCADALDRPDYWRE